MRYSSLGTCLVICATLAISNTCWGVDIPFEYLYGRWVKGHAPSGQLELHKGDSPKRTANYQYTANKWRVGLSRIRGRVFYYDDNSQTEWPIPSLYLRPAGNWQIGIDSLLIEDGYDCSTLNPRVPITSVRFRRRTEVSMSVNWLSDGLLSVPERDVPFSYFIRPLVGTGGMRADGTIWFRDFLEFGQSQVMTSHAFVKSGHYHVREWTAKAGLAWGFDDQLEVSAEIESRQRSVNSISNIGIGTTGEYPSLEHYRSWFSSAKPGYDISSTLLSLAPAYFVVGFGQQFGWQKSGNWVVYSESADSMSIYATGYISDFAGENTHMNLGFRYLTQGSFQTEVLLDDYSDFYHHMLFHRQMLLNVDFDYRRFGRRGDLASKEATLSAGGHAGLWNKLQAGVDWEYTWERKPREHLEYEVRTAASFTVLVRSYEYVPGQGPGWERDTPADIAFGSVPPQGHFYFSVTYNTPTWSRSTESKIGFLGLTDLDSDHSKRIVMSLSLGLGRGFMVTAEDEQSIFHSSVKDREFTGSLSARLGQRWHVVIGYSQQRSQYHTNDPSVQIGLSTLL